MSKRVICIETNQIYSSATEAAKANGTSVDMISAVCVGRCKTTKGKTFRYIDNDHNAILCHTEVPVTEKEITIQKHAVIRGKGKRCNENTNAVLCISTGQVFTSCTDAAEQIGTGQANMSRACRTLGAKANGKKFCYVKDINEHLDEVAESIRKANMYDELMTKEEKRKELLFEVNRHKANITAIEEEIAMLHEALKKEHAALEKAKDNLMYFN